MWCGPPVRPLWPRQRGWERLCSPPTVAWRSDAGAAISGTGRRRACCQWEGIRRSGTPKEWVLTQPESGPSPASLKKRSRPSSSCTCNRRTPMLSRQGPVLSDQMMGELRYLPLRTMRPRCMQPPTTSQTVPGRGGLTTSSSSAPPHGGPRGSVGAAPSGRAAAEASRTPSPAAAAAALASAATGPSPGTGRAAPPGASAPAVTAAAAPESEVSKAAEL
mmetsp:Transcript_30922/g.91929  ORF Transcript_30922/g.91929 Transcript_30922/m.91929 type:complete len:219 (-) Transcript_30922:1024-1680(-)